MADQADAVDMVLVGPADRLVALLHLLDDVGLARHFQEGRQPVMMLDDAVGDRSGRHLARPAHHHRNAEGAFPIGVLFAAERRGAAIGPAVAMRAVVGRILDQRILGDAQFVQQVEQLANILVMVDHGVVIVGLPAAGLALAARLGVREHVHMGGVHPYEPRLSIGLRLLDEL